MKTWEVIKVLMENPKSKFKNLRFGGVLGYLPKGVLGWISDSSKIGEAFEIHRVDGERHSGNWNDDWELVREPVPWQEAIQSLLAGKDIEVELDGVIYRMSANDSDLALHKNIYKKGKWFIK